MTVVGGADSLLIETAAVAGPPACVGAAVADSEEVRSPSANQTPITTAISTAAPPAAISFGPPGQCALPVPGGDGSEVKTGAGNDGGGA